ncbi:hypothetical protein HAZT_HAZT011227 [Hyalella azteca]|uniref:Tonsoku-like protein n=1 Tax=Hyalella azteca TaxID=294128 RepID=A0A6A0GWX5_HYAAZ|nr:tonsoku-like protein [Hyalella azteca]XP_018026949.1 tonsoku-like protein [Hyalella azteca]XP_018026950.1 tonsoku-like protein [Hyalella azteca]XP_047739357.1 tonsoku-like protein [Hyalella azteca]KAA0190713.1 hypothetical protein HAZT_HAZT011227 [Hyalella azteca]
MGRKKFSKELRLAEQRNDWREIATLCNALGSELQSTGDFSEALNYHRRELHACTKLNDTLGMGVAHRRVGEVLFELGETEAALQHQEQHLVLATEANSVLEQQRAYATIGRTQLDRIERATTSPEKNDAINCAKDNFLKSLEKCKDLMPGEVLPNELALMRCRLYLNLGLVADHKGDTKQASDLIKQAATLARQHSFHEDLYRCHDALCFQYVKQDKIGLALEESKVAVTISVKLEPCKRVEAHRTLGLLYLRLDNIALAKRAFTSAFKIAQADRSDVASLKPLVKTTSELFKLENQEEISDEEQLKILEKRGDLYANLKYPDQAILNYKKLIEKSLTLGKSESEIAPIYYSLAKTYEEDKRYAEAKAYYKKEYDVRLKTDPKEACKTLLCIALLGEQLSESSEQLQIYYNEALALAQRANCGKLQMHVLRTQAALDELQPMVKESLLQKIETVKTVFNLDSDCEFSEDESDKESNESSFELSESESENEASPRARAPNSIIVRNIEKCNYFGETPLHKACINGELAKAKTLVKHGHRINVRDKAGWLPLHEACNHGHLELVKFLLSVGAHINDRGGTDCNGITPLHDAASCGNLDIVKLLLEKGASVVCKNDDGETPLECLLSYKLRAENLTDDQILEIDIVAEELKSMMEKQGCYVNLTTFMSKSSSSSEANHLMRKSPTGNNQFSLSQITDNTEKADELASAIVYSDDDDALPSAQPRRPRPRAGAVARYRNAISELGSAVSRNAADDRPSVIDLPLLDTSCAHKELKAKSGLIEENEFVGENDFIEQDTRTSSKRKRPLSKSYVDFTVSSKARKILREKSPAERLSKDQKSRRRFKQVKLSSMLERFPTVRRNEEDDRSVDSDNGYLSDNLEISDVSSVSRNHTASKAGASSSNFLSFADTVSAGPGTRVACDSSNNAAPIRIRVNVEDKILLVPIADSRRDRTIEWLCSEISSRYYQLAGIKPTLGLQTHDGALLHPSDPITMVLGEEKEELTAIVSAWELPPLHLRYSQDCVLQQVAPCPRIITTLTKAESSSVLELQRVTRCPAQIRLVLRALQRNQSLHSLSLANTNLGDDGFEVLLDILPSIPNLSSLDVHACAISQKSISELIKRLPSFSKCGISVLNLGYNAMFGCSYSEIVGLLSLPKLTSINLQHCLLDIREAEAVQVSDNVRTLMLDGNSFTAPVIKNLLMCVPNLKHLSLRGVRCTTEGSAGIGAALAELLGGGEQCMLETLDLTFANISSYDLEVIRPYFYRCPFLCSVNISHNARLTSECIKSLLNELETNMAVPVSTLLLHGIDEFTEELSLAFARLINVKFRLNKPFQSVSFRVSTHTDIITDAWKLIYGHKSQVRRVGQDSFLDVLI